MEALALLGHDLDRHAKAFLREQAEAGGGCLAPTMESIGALITLPE
ncbi:hypothetical protein ABTX61_09315 [Amycolatopsis japonica]